MSLAARQDCCSAIDYIRKGEYGIAVIRLKQALRETQDRRAWSKLMLAIRELSRIQPEEV